MGKRAGSRREGENGERKGKVHFPSPSRHSQESFCLHLNYNIPKNKADLFPSHLYQCLSCYLYKTHNPQGGRTSPLR